MRHGHWRERKKEYGMGQGDRKCKTSNLLFREPHARMNPT